MSMNVKLSPMKLDTHQFDVLCGLLELAMTMREGLLEKTGFEVVWELTVGECSAVDKCNANDVELWYARSPDAPEWFVHQPKLNAAEIALTELAKQCVAAYEAGDGSWVNEEKFAESKGMTVDELRVARGEWVPKDEAPDENQ